jgi:hypothetical protein
MSVKSSTTGDKKPKWRATAILPSAFNPVGGEKMENFNNNADYLRSVVRFIDDRPEFENDGKSIQELINDYSAYLKTLYDQQTANGEVVSVDEIDE